MGAISSHMESFPDTTPQKHADWIHCQDESHDDIRQLKFNAMAFGCVLRWNDATPSDENSHSDNDIVMQADVLSGEYSILSGDEEVRLQMQLPKQANDGRASAGFAPTIKRKHVEQHRSLHRHNISTSTNLNVLKKQLRQQATFFRQSTFQLGEPAPRRSASLCDLAMALG